MTAIRIQNIIKEYRNGVQALSGLSLTVRQGEIFSLLGENGAGKSTLINILTTYLPPTSGSVSMLGKDLYKEAAAIRAEIACVSQGTSIDTHLSLIENMMFQSRLYKIPKTEAVKRMKSLINAFGLERYIEHPVSSCSGGVKRRLDIALNMMSHPKILFMDEPTVGMDIQSRIAMWDMIKKIHSDFGTTILFTTHYLEEADRLCDTVCIMKEGKEIVQDTPASLRKYMRQNMIQITFPCSDAAKMCSIQMKNHFDMQHNNIRGNCILLNVENECGTAKLEHINRFLLESKITFTGITITQPSLEDVFLRLTGKS